MSLLKTLGLPPPPRLRNAQAAAPAAEGDAAEAPAAGAPTKAAKKGDANVAAAGVAGRYSAAAQAWESVLAQAASQIDALKQGVLQRCADVDPALAQQAARGLARFDAILPALGTGLVDALKAAEQAGNDAARRDALKTAKAVVERHIGYVAGEALLAHAERNPFNVACSLKALLAGGLRKAAQAVS